MATILDFGNGVVVTDDAFGIVITGHSGIEYPEVDVPTVEAAVRDGGTIGTSRAKMRRMTVALDFTGTYTRTQVAALFSPGVVRTLSSPKGSMPYMVEAVTFDGAVKGSVAASVTMLSDYAYPVAQAASVTFSEGSGTFDSSGDVDCPAQFNCTIAADTSGVLLATTTGMATLKGTFKTNDVVVVSSVDNTVTVNNVNRISWFDRSGKFPRLVAGSNIVVANDSAGTPLAITVYWNPRVMGLI